MNPEIEKLIDLSLADGQITEKERNVIIKKGIAYGLDKDEIEMLIDSKKQMHDKKTTEDVIKCPSCGRKLSGLSKTCNCGYVFNTGKIQESKSLESAIETLEDLIVQVRGLSKSASNDVVESLIARVEKENRYIKTRYSENNEVKKLLSELELISEKYINKALKKQKKKKYVNIFIFSVIILFASILLYKKITKKNRSEVFIETVEDNYIEKYKLYKSSEQYQIDLRNFNNLYIASRLCNNFTSQQTKDSLNKEWDKWNTNQNISEFYFYSKASACYLNNDLINAKLFLDTSLVLNPDFSPSYFRYHQVVENKDSSLKFISKAISLDEEFGYIYLPYRSVLYYDKHDYQNSLNDIKLYLEKYPKNLPLDLERYIWKISVMIDAGLKSEACTEFHKINSNQIDELKNKWTDAYELINNNCKKL